MTVINIKVQGFKELTSNLKEAKGMVEPLTRTALNKSAMAIKYSAIDNAPVFEGRLKGSIKHDVLALTAKVWAGAKYALYVEEGTRPHYPPIAPLKIWAERKLGNGALGYAIQQKIGREGTKPQPFMRPAVDSNINNILGYFNELSNQLLRIMAK